MDQKNKIIDDARKCSGDKKLDALTPQSDEEKWSELKKKLYGTKCLATSEWGLIDFDPASLKNLVGGENLSYDDYLEIMRLTAGDVRHYFETCYYFAFALGFKGQIEKICNGKICFNRIYVSGMYGDGIGFDGKENHVWMDATGFEMFGVGDCLEFAAEVYRYLKTGNGKAIDFALRNPHSVKKIDYYSVPDEDELLMQEIDRLICEVCMYNEHCYMGNCIADEAWRDHMRGELFAVAKNGAYSG